MKDPMVLKYIPKRKLSAIKSCWHDSDGYWIMLNEEYNADNVDSNCRTIHEDTIKQLRYQIAGIRRVKYPVGKWNYIKKKNGTYFVCSLCGVTKIAPTEACPNRKCDAYMKNWDVVEHESHWVNHHK